MPKKIKLTLLTYRSFPDKLVRLKSPLSEFVKNQPRVKTEAANIVKHFIGKNTPYGTGECMLWEHTVTVDCLKYSSNVLNKLKWESPIISLSDIIRWSDFKIKSFGYKGNIVSKM